MASRPLNRPGARMLNHVELVYAPGERPLARSLFEGLGFRVLDPQTDPIPESLGPAVAPYLIVYLDSDDDDAFDNVLYASEASVDQWRFECALRERLADDRELAALHRNLRQAYARAPQGMTHFGVAYPSVEEVEAAMARVANTPQLEGRVTLSDLYKPGGAGAADAPVAQAFVHTDVLTAGLLCAGQQIELQVRLDGV
ncbi:MAG: hypothetical protein JRG84_19670 [Deltaproteobacteria bacterium]|nr:hypothetical protein [Deltaproteobacteria bacterium]